MSTKVDSRIHEIVAEAADIFRDLLQEPRKAISSVDGPSQTVDLPTAEYLALHDLYYGSDTNDDMPSGSCGCF